MQNNILNKSQDFINVLGFLFMMLIKTNMYDIYGLKICLYKNVIEIRLDCDADVKVFW